MTGLSESSIYAVSLSCSNGALAKVWGGNIGEVWPGGWREVRDGPDTESGNGIGLHDLPFSLSRKTCQQEISLQRSKAKSQLWRWWELKRFSCVIYRPNRAKRFQKEQRWLEVYGKKAQRVLWQGGCSRKNFHPRIKVSCEELMHIITCNMIWSWPTSFHHSQFSLSPIQGHVQH